MQGCKDLQELSQLELSEKDVFVVVVVAYKTGQKLFAVVVVAGVVVFIVAVVVVDDDDDDVNVVVVDCNCNCLFFTLII